MIKITGLFFLTLLISSLIMVHPAMAKSTLTQQFAPATNDPIRDQTLGPMEISAVHPLLETLLGKALYQRLIESENFIIFNEWLTQFSE